MIDLTPLEVRKKKGDFPRSFRGYDKAEVDLFLDLVADRLEELVNRAMQLEQELAALRAEVDARREREEALTGALVSAERLRDEITLQARKEAELLVREAEAEAERLKAAALRAVEQEEDGIRRLRARRVQLLRSFRSFLERELHEVDAMSEALESGEGVSFLQDRRRVERRPPFEAGRAAPGPEASPERVEAE